MGPEATGSLCVEPLFCRLNAPLEVDDPAGSESGPATTSVTADSAPVTAVDESGDADQVDKRATPHDRNAPIDSPTLPPRSPTSSARSTPVESTPTGQGRSVDELLRLRRLHRDNPESPALPRVPVHQLELELDQALACIESLRVTEGIFRRRASTSHGLTYTRLASLLDRGNPPERPAMESFRTIIPVPTVIAPGPDPILPYHLYSGEMFLYRDHLRIHDHPEPTDPQWVIEAHVRGWRNTEDDLPEHLLEPDSYGLPNIFPHPAGDQIISPFLAASDQRRQGPLPERWAVGPRENVGVSRAAGPSGSTPRETVATTSAESATPPTESPSHAPVTGRTVSAPLDQAGPNPPATPLPPRLDPDLGLAIQSILDSESTHSTPTPAVPLASHSSIGPTPVQTPLPTASTPLAAAKTPAPLQPPTRAHHASDQVDTTATGQGNETESREQQEKGTEATEPRRGSRLRKPTAKASSAPELMASTSVNKGTK